jgi:hypothetical protein
MTRKQIILLIFIVLIIVGLIIPFIFRTNSESANQTINLSATLIGAIASLLTFILAFLLYNKFGKPQTLPTQLNKQLMIKNKFCYLTTLLLFQTVFVFGQGAKIEVPNFNDKYSDYVKQLESGKTDIDYADFRNSFLESKQFGKKSTNYDNLKKKVYAEIKNNNYQAVINLTKAMLSIDYTSMFAHKYLQQTYNILGDTINRNKYHDIEFGLLYSITESGDGKTCETGWHVTQIEEEYFILNMIGAELKMQSISSADKNTCDKMVVKTDEGETETYYFEANKVFEMESKMFGK